MRNKIFKKKNPFIDVALCTTMFEFYGENDIVIESIQSNLFLKRIMKNKVFLK